MNDNVGLVYLVHDDSDTLLSLYETLSGAGFRVAASSSAVDGLSYLARTRPPALLYGWPMPEMEGEEFIERVKRISPGTRVLVCLRKADKRLVDRVLRLGGTEVLLEPISPSAVIHAISRMAVLGVPHDASDTPFVDASFKTERPSRRTQA